MSFDPYQETTLTRDEVDALPGPVVVEFGASWCGICAAFTPQAEVVFADFPAVRHMRVEDGPGKRLGRSFRVKLWPSFVFMRDGQVMQQLARPRASEVRAALEAITESV